jgi:putative serine protease PepD
MRKVAHLSRGRLAIAASTLACLAALAGCAGARHRTATPAAPVNTLQSRFVSTVSAVSPSVVLIRTPQALGSGIVFDHRGDVVTNAHVVAGATRFTATLFGGRHISATLVGTDSSNDLAVIHLTGATPPPASFGDSSKVRVGDIALAIGNPLGLHSSVTQGIVSSVGRTVPEGNGVTLTSAIQTSAEINPGNSGGALVDLDHDVIGVPTLIAADPEFGDMPAAGIGFAISSNRVKSVASRILAGASRPAG